MHTPSPDHEQRKVVSARSVVLGPGLTVLLLQRAASSSRDRGKWENPGGKVERKVSKTGGHYLESKETARKRELEEETGYIVENLDLHIHEHKRTMPENGRLFIVTHRLVKVIGGNLLLSPEHSAHAYPRYDEVFDMFLTDDAREALTYYQPFVRAIASTALFRPWAED